MAPLSRKPGQGTWNVVRFNWPLYAGGGLAAAAGLLLARRGPARLRPLARLGAALAAVPLLGSLAASAWVYDLSGLYGLDWLPAGVLPTEGPATLLTVQAGFDEISALLARRYPAAQVLALDFYDPTRHTEPSIGRARAAYPPYPGTLAVATGALPLASASADGAVVFLAAHEIRDAAERTAFFRELRRVLRPGAALVVVEHLRDAANFLAYTAGFLHFHSRRSWLAALRAGGLHLRRELKITPFLSAFILDANHDAA